MKVEQKGTLRLMPVAIPTATAAKMLYTFTRPISGDLICTAEKLIRYNEESVEWNLNPLAMCAFDISGDWQQSSCLKQC